MPNGPLSLPAPAQQGVHIRGKLVWTVICLVIGFLGAATYSALNKGPGEQRIYVNNNGNSRPPTELTRAPDKPLAEKPIDNTPVPEKEQSETKTVIVQQASTPAPPREKSEAQKALEKGMRADLVAWSKEKNGKAEDHPQVLEVGLEQEKSPYELKGTVYPMSKYMLAAGSTIEVVLDKPIQSELVGSAYAIVARDVYDSATQQHKLVPQGAKVQVTYDSQTVDGQGRLLVLANRIMLPPTNRFPYGSSVGLDGNPVSDREGYNGLKDKVNRHILPTIGKALAFAAIAAGVGMANGGSNGKYYYDPQDPTNAATRALGRELDRGASNALRRNESQGPTFTIRHGMPFTITLDKDLPFQEPFKPLDQATAMQVALDEEEAME